AGCTAALHEQIARQDATLSDLRTGIDGLRSDLGSLRSEVTALRTALEAGLGRAVAIQESDQAVAREAGEALAGRLAPRERRLDELADGVTGLEGSVATLAEQLARQEPGNAALPRTRSTRPRAGPPMAAEELFDRGMESFRVGELGQAVLDFEE